MGNEQSHQRHGNSPLALMKPPEQVAKSLAMVPSIPANPGGPIAATTGGTQMKISRHGKKVESLSPGIDSNATAQTFEGAFSASSTGTGQAIASTRLTATSASPDNQGILTRNRAGGHGFAAARGNASAQVGFNSSMAVAVESSTGRAQAIRKRGDIIIESHGTGSAGLTGNTLWAADGNNIAVAQANGNRKECCSRCRQSKLFRKAASPCRNPNCACHRVTQDAGLNIPPSRFLKY